MFGFENNPQTDIDEEHAFYKHQLGNLISYIPLISVMLLAGCNSPSTKPVNLSSFTEKYPYACTSEPEIPWCATDTLSVGFEVDLLFDACRASMANFFSAQEIFYNCKKDDAEILFDQVLTDAMITRDCYEKQLDEVSSSQDPSTICPKIKSPDIKAILNLNAYFNGLNYEVADVSIDNTVGLPYCATNQLFGFKLEDCLNELNNYLGVDRYGKSEPKRLYQKYLDELKVSLSSLSEVATRKFNCKANREKFCL